MSKEQVILQILQDAGIYERVREKVRDDSELVKLFDQDFEKLVDQVQKQKASPGSIWEGQKQFKIGNI